MACELKMSYSPEGQVSEGQYDEWMRVSLPTGGRKGVIGESVLKVQSNEKGKMP